MHGCARRKEGSEVVGPYVGRPPSSHPSVIRHHQPQKNRPPPRTKNTQAQAQSQAILKFLPFMVGYFSLNVPSGLGVYWIANNLITTLTT